MRALLTSKQKRIYDFIISYIANHKKAPYIREIQEACRINSYKSVVDKLLSMEKKGYIKRRINKHRSIKLTKSVALEFEQDKLQADGKELIQEDKVEVQI